MHLLGNRPATRVWDATPQKRSLVSIYEEGSGFAFPEHDDENEDADEGEESAAHGNAVEVHDEQREASV